jgi:hypothetical protein
MKTPNHLEIDLDEDAGTDVYAIGNGTDGVSEAVLLAAGEDVVNEDVELADKLPKNARKNADGSVTVTLQFPQVVKSQKDGRLKEYRFDQVVMHRLNGADQRAIGAVSEDLQPVIAFGRSTRTQQAVMNALYNKLDMADINAMGQVLNHFLGSGPKTGR